MLIRQTNVFVHVEGNNVLEKIKPFLFRSINSLYIHNGDEPVEHPNTNGFPGVGLAALILAAT